MERFDCPIHSGPLVVLEEVAKDCGCPNSRHWMTVHGTNDFVEYPVVIPAECLRNRPTAICAVCRQWVKPRYATRPCVEEAVTA